MSHEKVRALAVETDRVKDECFPDSSGRTSMANALSFLLGLPVDCVDLAADALASTIDDAVENPDDRQEVFEWTFFYAILYGIAAERLSKLNVEPPPAADHVVTSIVGCARCHGDGHEDIVFERLDHPLEVYSHQLDRVVEATHWASCPTNGQPILMSVVSRYG